MLGQCSTWSDSASYSRTVHHILGQAHVKTVQHILVQDSAAHVKTVKHMLGRCSTLKDSAAHVSTVQHI